MPVDEALEVCCQVTEGLEAAHEKGVIHRDLKPANVIITTEGKVKILDFGLAKALQDEMPAADASKSPTLTDHMTHAGVILGTAAYMAPEQAKGKTVDKRSDIWAFGCVMYECLTGKRAFEGESLSETMASILRGEPDWQAIPAVVPSRVKDLLRRCVAKDPKERLHDIADARIEIGEAKIAQPAGVRQALGSETVRGGNLAWIVAAVMMMLAAVFAARSLMLPEQPPKQPMRFVVSLPAPIVAMPSDFPSVAISADGQQLAYVGGFPSAHLYHRRLDELEFKPIASFEGPTGNPFFSPDGKWIAYFADGWLKKSPVAGGPATPFTGFLGSFAGGGRWEDDDYIYYQRGYRDGIYRLPASGGEQERLILPDFQKGDGCILWPQKLPGQDRILFTVSSPDIVSMDDSQIAVQSLGTKPERKNLVGGTFGRYLPTGHLVFGHDGKLMAAPFDLAKLTKTGDDVTVLDGILMLPYTGKADFAVSNTGHLVYVPGTMVRSNDSFLLIDRNGNEQVISPPRGEKDSFRFDSLGLSPDGLRIAVVLSQANDEIRVYDFSGGTFPRETFEGGDERSPVWHPLDGSLAYTSEPGPVAQMFIKKMGATEKPKAIFSSNNARYPSSFSPNGKELAFEERDPKTGWDIWIGSVDTEGQPKAFLKTDYLECFPAFSPDGHWIAYQSDKSGQADVYVARYPEGTDEKPISLEGGTEPRWAASGKELFYRSGNKFFAVEIELQPAFRAGKRRMLFTTDPSLMPSSKPPYPRYAVKPDGQGFIFIKPSQHKLISQICVVLNWFEELKRLCPTGKK
jgi:Tol biopolymer transport system component